MSRKNNKKRMKAKEDHIARRESYIKGKSRTGRVEKRVTVVPTAAAVANPNAMELEAGEEQQEKSEIVASSSSEAPTRAAVVAMTDKEELTPEEVEAAAAEAKALLMKRKRTMKSRRLRMKHNKWITQKRGGDGLLRVPAFPQKL
jgi:hypothetical protein